jgi:acyl-coenzyme A thioesterase PaaI-like protein
MIGPSSKDAYFSFHKTRLDGSRADYDPRGICTAFSDKSISRHTRPLFYRPTGEGFIIGVRIAEKHCNSGGTAHGGFLVTLADIALGYTAAASGDLPLGF